MVWGESGGGAKTSAIYAMPAAAPYFHKASIESGPGLRMTEREDAARTTRYVLDQLRRLRAIEDAARGTKRPDVRELLRTLVELYFAPFGGDQVAGGYEAQDRGSLRKLFGRALMDPSLVVVADMNRIFEEPIVLFLVLMRRACPDLAVSELDWRIDCIIGAHLFSLVHTERMGRFFGQDAQVPDELAAEWVLNFFMYGISAPPSAVKKAKPPKA